MLRQRRKAGDLSSTLCRIGEVRLELPHCGKPEMIHLLLPSSFSSQSVRHSARRSYILTSAIPVSSHRLSSQLSEILRSICLATTPATKKWMDSYRRGRFLERAFVSQPSRSAWLQSHIATGHRSRCLRNRPTDAEVVFANLPQFQLRTETVRTNEPIPSQFITIVDVPT